MAAEVARNRACRQGRPAVESHAVIERVNPKLPSIRMRNLPARIEQQGGSGIKYCVPYAAGVDHSGDFQCDASGSSGKTMENKPPLRRTMVLAGAAALATADVAISQDAGRVLTAGV
jgi:hypothetical protein